MYPIMRSMDSTLYLQAAGDPKAVVKFFTLEHLMRHYKCVYMCVFACVVVVVVVVYCCVCMHNKCIHVYLLQSLCDVCM